MRILSYLNVSNMSNLEADSGYVFQRSLLEELYRCGHDVTLIGPAAMPNLAEELGIIEVPFSQSKYGVRMGFQWDTLRDKLAIVPPPDIVLVNQSELTVNMFALLGEVFGKCIPCATYYHYLAVEGWDSIKGEPIFDPSQNLNGMARFIWNRQCESASLSNANIIGSEWGKSLFLKASRGSIGVLDSSEDKFHIIPPPVQDYSFDKSILPSNSVPAILYNHRLYNHYGGRKIFEWLEEFRRTYSIEFKLFITDPTAKRSALRNKLDTSVEELKAFLQTLEFVEFKYCETQKEYCELIRAVDVGLGHLRSGALWSMAVADMMSLGKPVLAYREAAMPEIVGDEDLLFASKSEFFHKLQRLLASIDFRQSKGKIAQARTKQLSLKLIGEAFECVFKEILERERTI